MENELEQKQVGQLITEISKFGGMDKTQATQLASILMPHIQTHADNQFNAGIEAALGALPENLDPRSIDAGNELYQRIGDSPAANFRHGFTLGQGLALDQARAAIEELKK